MRRVLLLAPLVALLAACGGDDDETEPPSSTVAAAATEPTSAVSSTTTVPPTTAPLATSDATLVPMTSRPAAPNPPPDGPVSADETQAVADLAARLGVEPATITTVAVEAVTWRDGAIGCPQPGMNYTQALVEGVRVILEVGGKRYQYHAGGARPLFLCEKPEPAAGE
jgi:hypothetical protein